MIMMMVTMAPNRIKNTDEKLIETGQHALDQRTAAQQTRTVIRVGLMLNGFFELTKSSSMSQRTPELQARNTCIHSLESRGAVNVPKLLPTSNTVQNFFFRGIAEPMVFSIWFVLRA